MAESHLLVGGGLGIKGEEASAEYLLAVGGRGKRGDL